VGFETIWGIIEALYGKNIFEIAIWPPNCESWAKKHAVSFTSAKWLCNRVGFHHAGFESFLWDIEKL